MHHKSEILRKGCEMESRVNTRMHQTNPQGADLKMLQQHVLMYYTYIVHVSIHTSVSLQHLQYLESNSEVIIPLMFYILRHEWQRMKRNRWFGLLLGFQGRSYLVH